MGSNYYPWGPHGPQGGPNQVTPNPTPAYVPPPSNPVSYGAPAPATYGAPGRGAHQGTYTYTPGPKHYWLALLLTFIFGPLGLFYASKKGALLLLVLLFAVPYSLASLGVWPGTFHRHPLYILQHDAVMNQMWSLCVGVSMIWSVIGVRRYNKAFKAGK